MSNHPYSLFGFGVVIRGVDIDDAPDDLLVLQVGIQVDGPHNEMFVCVKESYSDSGAYSYEKLNNIHLASEQPDWVNRIERFIEDRGLTANVISGYPTFIHASHFGLPWPPTPPAPTACS